MSITLKFYKHLKPLRTHLREVEILLNSGADVNLQDSWGNSPLHWAARGGHLEVTRMLLDADNIDINLQSNSGKYLYYISIQFMNISLLSNYGKLKIW